MKQAQDEKSHAMQNTFVKCIEQVKRYAKASMSFEFLNQIFKHSKVAIIFAQEKKSELACKHSKEVRGESENGNSLPTLCYRNHFSNFSFSRCRFLSIYVHI